MVASSVGLLSVRPPCPEEDRRTESSRARQRLPSRRQGRHDSRRQARRLRLDAGCAALRARFARETPERPASKGRSWSRRRLIGSAPRARSPPPLPANGRLALRCLPTCRPVRSGGPSPVRAGPASKPASSGSAGVPRSWRSRNRTLGSPYEVRSGAVGPDLELLLRGGAERVGSPDEHRAPMLRELSRELPDGRRLSGPVDADHEDNGRGRRLLGASTGGAPEKAPRPPRRARPRGRPSPAPRLESAVRLGGCRDPDVGTEQRDLEPLPGVLLRRVERSAESATRARRLLPSDSRRREKKPLRSRVFPLTLLAVTQQLGPRPRHRKRNASDRLETGLCSSPNPAARHVGRSAHASFRSRAGQAVAAAPRRAAGAARRSARPRRLPSSRRRARQPPPSSASGA